jgi:hypothetical protein
MSKGPKTKFKPKRESVRPGGDPDSFLWQTPVWRFSDFDWDGPWGLSTCVHKVNHLQTHFQQHLSSLETMTWAEILRAAGGKGEGKGNNSHEIARDNFKKLAIKRLDAKGIMSDTIFSLRLDQGTRVYGVREGRCLKITFFDPHHIDKSKSAYDWG